MNGPFFTRFGLFLLTKSIKVSYCAVTWDLDSANHDVSPGHLSSGESYEASVTQPTNAPKWDSGSGASTSFPKR